METSPSSPKKKVCKYGNKCYRKNAEHLKAYAHSEEENNENIPSPKQQKQKRSSKTRERSGSRSRSPVMKSNDKKEEEAASAEHFDLTNYGELEKLVSEQTQMKMPADFYALLDFCKHLKPKDPKHALLDTLDIELAGVYDLVVSGLKVDYKVHSRFFYDPPEFQTVLVVKSSNTGLHFGYFRDDPNEMPNFVAINEAKVDGKIYAKGDNLFAALNWYMGEILSNHAYKASGSDKEIKELREQMTKWLDKHHKKTTFSMQLKTPGMKARDKLVNAKTFHTAGICVPVNDSGFGYREIPETYETQKKMFTNFAGKNDPDPIIKNRGTKADEQIQEILTLIQFANDELDFGMGLEFGLNMFSHGDLSLHRFIRLTLPTVYELLGRGYYGEIILEHLNNRK